MLDKTVCFKRPAVTHGKKEIKLQWKPFFMSAFILKDFLFFSWIATGLLKVVKSKNYLSLQILPPFHHYDRDVSATHVGSHGVNREAVLLSFPSCCLLKQPEQTYLQLL